MDSIQYDKQHLTIVYPNYGSVNRNYSDLFDFLGDYDIISASEIGQDVIIMSGIVFFFSNQDEGILKKRGQVALEKVCKLEEFVDMDISDHQNFMRWYS